jgi:hypothetical protein
VIGYKHEEGNYKPFHIEEELGLDNCGHGEKGCTSCTRACPRFRTWEPDADMHLFGKTRDDSAMYGQFKQLLLVRAADDNVHQKGQDGGFVSAMLIWLMKHDYIDAALTSFMEGDGTLQRALFEHAEATIWLRQSIKPISGFDRYPFTKRPVELQLLRPYNGIHTMTPPPS